MTKKALINICLIAVSLFFFVSCNKEQASNWNISISLKSYQVNVEDCQFVDVSAKLKEINTGNLVDIPNTNSFKLAATQVPEGNYIVDVVGKLIRPSGKEESFKGTTDNFLVFEKSLFKEINIFITGFNNNDEDNDQIGDFLIKEVFFTGTLNEQGLQYDGDKYIIITNNSNKDLYADGLLIARSHFQFDLGTLSAPTHSNYVPDIINQAFPVSDIIQIPGNGTDVLVKQGGNIIICDNAINHTEHNSNSIDFTSGPTKADFEWFTDLNFEVDNPEVPNMINFYSWNNGFIMHNRGLQTLALVRLPKDMTQEKYIAEYKYDFEYTFSFGATTKQIEGKGGYKIPNEWIIDGVCSGLKDDFSKSYISQSIDMGHTWCAKNNSDAERYGKSICRKVAGESNSIVKFVDTNNSSDDFIPLHTPTLLSNRRFFSFK